MGTDAQKRASLKWEAENTVQIKLKLHRVNDADILARLEASGNKQGYIKELIRADMERKNNG